MPFYVVVEEGQPRILPQDRSFSAMRWVDLWTPPAEGEEGEGTVEPVRVEASFPPNWFKKANEDDIESLNAFVLADPEPPEGKFLPTPPDASMIKVVDGEPAWDIQWSDIPVPTLADRAAILEGRINALRDQKINDGFNHADHRFQSAPSDRENISGLGTDAAEAIRDGAEAGDYLWHPAFPAGFGFITADNQTIPLDAFQMRDLRTAGVAFKGVLTFYARTLKDAVQAALSGDDEEAMAALEAGYAENWPT